MKKEDSEEYFATPIVLQFESIKTEKGYHRIGSEKTIFNDPTYRVYANYVQGRVEGITMEEFSTLVRGNNK